MGVLLTAILPLLSQSLAPNGHSINVYWKHDFHKCQGCNAQVKASILFSDIVCFGISFKKETKTFDLNTPNGKGELKLWTFSESSPSKVTAGPP